MLRHKHIYDPQKTNLTDEITQRNDFFHECKNMDVSVEVMVASAVSHN
jgi:hypothetical protein